MRLPASVALPLSSTANSVVDALFATKKAVVEAALSGPHTVRREYGVVVPMPMLPVERLVPSPLMPVPKIRLPMSSWLLPFVLGRAMSYPRIMLLEPVAVVEAAFIPRKIFRLPVVSTNPEFEPTRVLFEKELPETP